LETKKEEKNNYKR